MSQYGTCEECNQENTGWYWCRVCNAKRFQQDFKNWTSGNDDIDKFIQHTQLSATVWREALEWIPYDRFNDINYIAKGGFGTVYKAKRIDGYIWKWDNKNKNWIRIEPDKLVALKSLDHSEHVTLEFINEIASHHKVNDDNYVIRLYGITQDPKTKDYMMVLNFATEGSLRYYLDTNKNYKSHKSWKDKIHDLSNIAIGLKTIHENGLIHRDLHIGNVLKGRGAFITDMGLCKPANYNNTSENKVYGVVPYVAPEVLRGQKYTKASDIYSFGIIIYEVISGLYPYYDVSHDNLLAVKICRGLRPRFDIKVPQLIVDLIKRCLDANPLSRPTAIELLENLKKWNSELNNDEQQQSELIRQTREADEINDNLLATSSKSSTNLGSYETHSGAVYTSRLLNLNNLPEPKNSDDYYKQSDNIISIESSEILNLDLSQLEINDAEEKNEKE